MHQIRLINSYHNPNQSLQYQFQFPRVHIQIIKDHEKCNECLTYYNQDNPRLQQQIILMANAKLAQIQEQEQRDLALAYRKMYKDEEDDDKDTIEVIRKIKPGNPTNNETKKKKTSRTTISSSSNSSKCLGDSQFLSSSEEEEEEEIIMLGGKRGSGSVGGVHLPPQGDSKMHESVRYHRGLNPDEKRVGVEKRKSCFVPEGILKVGGLGGGYFHFGSEGKGNKDKRDEDSGQGSDPETEGPYEINPATWNSTSPPHTRKVIGLANNAKEEFRRVVTAANNDAVRAAAKTEKIIKHAKERIEAEKADDDRVENEGRDHNYKKEGGALFYGEDDVDHSVTPSSPMVRRNLQTLLRPDAPEFSPRTHIPEPKHEEKNRFDSVPKPAENWKNNHSAVVLEVPAETSRKNHSALIPGPAETSKKNQSALVPETSKNNQSALVPETSKKNLAALVPETSKNNQSASVPEPMETLKKNDRLVKFSNVFPIDAIGKVPIISNFGVMNDPESEAEMITITVPRNEEKKEEEPKVEQKVTLSFSEFEKASKILDGFHLSKELDEELTRKLSSTLLAQTEDLETRGLRKTTPREMLRLNLMFLGQQIENPKSLMIILSELRMITKSDRKEIEEGRSVFQKSMLIIKSVLKDGGQLCEKDFGFRDFLSIAKHTRNRKLFDACSTIISEDRLADQ